MSRAVSHLLRLMDLGPEGVEQILTQARILKRTDRESLGHRLPGRVLGLLFEKPSTRTRISFEVAIHRLGGTSLYLAPEHLQLGRGEPIQDTVRVLSRYLDGVVLRTHRHETQELWARFSTIPVINGLSDRHHPCQALGDLLTIQEHRGGLSGRRLAYIGDGNNVAHSLLEAAALTGMHLTLACPPGYRPDPALVAEAQEVGRKTGAQIQVVGDPQEAARGAEMLYTDVWVSMGQEAETEARRRAFQGYCLDQQLLSLAHPEALVMHCLPAHRGEEITEEVLEGPQSVVWDQAENRLYVQMALLVRFLGEEIRP